MDEANHGGWTPLMFASYIGHDDIVNLLIDAGVDVNKVNNKQQTPLMLAASCGNESAAFFLLQVRYQVIVIITLTLVALHVFA